MRKRPDPARSASPLWRFALLLALLLAALFAARPVSLSGDILEYSVNTVGIAAHGTPDLRIEDFERTKALAPERFTPLFAMLQDEMRRGVQDVYPAFQRGSSGHVYSVHFFGYPMMAALPLRLLEALGQEPFKAFQVVNLVFVFILGLALHRFFGASGRAALALALFMLCGGVLYWNWSSPETVGAASLLAGLLLFTAGMPVAGSVLAGLAAQQNPTIVFFFLFAPFIRAAVGRMQPIPPVSLARLLSALGLGLAVAAVPVLFNLIEYGVPNLIASRFSRASLISTTRLVSFFFDLNQGMILAIPGVLLGLLLARGAALRLLLLCFALTLALVLPALAVINWNSAAAGPMRYAFWAAMPLLFALLAMLRELRRWRVAALGAVLLVQGAAMAHAVRYEYNEFSPLATLVLRHLPRHYYPEPEIFAERMAHHDNWVEPDRVHSFHVDGWRFRTLVNDGDPHAATSLCGPGAQLAPDNAFTRSSRGWRYIDGQVVCLARGVRQYTWLVDDIVAGGPVVLGAGWRGREATGIPSDGMRSQLRLRTPQGIRPAALVLRGSYATAGGRTHVTAGGVDLGWHALDAAPVIALPAAAQAAVLDLTLEHEAPGAVILQEVSVRPSTGSTP
ncbi:hypothetical protein LK542_23805 [Massilia sp. IC2-477]|uniref:hypothetical protein n=1 Tax=Massilia sp. IC2-477 TaxID=2887198 RepID=UPI001D108DBA|nr:hypothetical protein [Massilia sp. IC2-477]MCC2958641.1 hypothetical protein [Massilia sp. IC2-477]